MLAPTQCTTSLQKGAEMAEKETEKQLQCAHQWIIESPQGPTSKGVCKECGEQKEFYNALTDATSKSFTASRVFNAIPLNENTAQVRRGLKKEQDE